MNSWLSIIRLYGWPDFLSMCLNYYFYHFAHQNESSVKSVKGWSVVRLVPIYLKAPRPPAAGAKHRASGFLHISSLGTSQI